MTIYLFRSEVHGASSRSYLYSFCPIDADPEAGVAGSGEQPWRAVVVPFGSSIVADPVTGEQLLRITGQSGRHTAAEIARDATSEPPGAQSPVRASSGRGGAVVDPGARTPS